MPVSSVVSRTGAVLALAITVLVLSSPPVAAAPAPTQLNAADMLLLNGVRLAGLWEIPAGQMAEQKGSTSTVREVGREIAAQHVQLDQLVVDAANVLGASLPSTPTGEQQGWLGEMEASKGTRFDYTFVSRLRAAHGKIFPVIGAVRAATRNPVVRKLADQANTFVMNHMKMLESTGMVEYQDLPPAALPAAQDLSSNGIAKANAGLTPPVNPVLLWAVIAGAVVLGGLSFLRLRVGR